MAISFPRTDVLSSVSFEDQPQFQLVSRQEFSRTAFGTTIGKDLGSAIWFAAYTTISLANDDALKFEAYLNSLDGAVFPFEAWDLRRPYPKSNQTGAFNDTGILNSVNANNKALSISGLDAGFVLSVGDYLSFNYTTAYGTSRALHQVMEGVTANGSGLTSEFEVRPHIRPGWTLSGPTTAVRLKKPAGLFTLVPGSVSSRLNGPVNTVVSFKAQQYL
jgi:hypothetical protein